MRSGPNNILLAVEIVLCVLFPALVAGCRFVQTVANVPGQTVRAVTPGRKSKQTVDPLEVQQALLRFTDEFLTRMVLSSDRPGLDTNLVSRTEELRWKIALVSETTSIASGPNAVANLLDMTIFVTVMRKAMEEHGQPGIFGESGRPMVESSRTAEAEIWKLAGTLLKPEQQAELQHAIEGWQQQNPRPEDVMGARALGFAAQLAEANPAEATKGGSVFSLLKIDPLSGLDPAVREIAQTRLFAERALFVTQKLPLLLSWQTELLGINAAEIPAVQALVANSTRVSSSLERFATFAEGLPEQFRVERAEILKALESQEADLTPLVNEVRGTLTAGTQMSDSLNMTLTTLDAVMNRFGTTNRVSQTKPNSESFHIQDYTESASQLEAAARQLTELLVALDRVIGSTNLAHLSAQAAPVVQEAQSSGKQFVDYLFWKGALFVATVLVAGLIFRLLSVLLATRVKTHSL